MLGIVATPSAMLNEKAPALENEPSVLGPTVPSKEPIAVTELICVALVLISAMLSDTEPVMLDMPVVVAVAVCEAAALAPIETKDSVKPWDLLVAVPETGLVATGGDAIADAPKNPSAKTTEVSLKRFMV